MNSTVGGGNGNRNLNQLVLRRNVFLKGSKNTHKTIWLVKLNNADSLVTI